MEVPDGLDVEAVGRLLRSAYGGDVTITAVRRIRPWTVARCSLDGSDAPSTVIAKWLRSNPERFRVDRRQIVTEAAALKAVGDVASRVVPTLIGHDFDRDLMVIGDLAPRRTLHSRLAGGMTEAGHAGLHTFAATMARLHASTSAVEAEGPWDDNARVPLDADATTALLDRLHELVPVSGRLRGAVRDAHAELDEPGAFAAFSNGDSGANNCLIDDDGHDGRLIDFEHACRRHALLDAAAMHVPGSM